MDKKHFCQLFCMTMNLYIELLVHIFTTGTCRVYTCNLHKSSILQLLITLGKGLNLFERIYAEGKLNHSYTVS